MWQRDFFLMTEKWNNRLLNNNSIAFSFFIRKDEKYDYQYKTAYGPYTHKTEIKDKNKHYFAVLTLSGGYQYQLNKRISLQAEPYVKLPLAGVGEGKIKLNSAGILFTATVKPFAKKKWSGS